MVQRMTAATTDSAAGKGRFVMWSSLTNMLLCVVFLSSSSFDCAWAGGAFQSGPNSGAMYAGGLDYVNDSVYVTGITYDTNGENPTKESSCFVSKLNSRYLQHHDSAISSHIGDGDVMEACHGLSLLHDPLVPFEGEFKPFVVSGTSDPNGVYGSSQNIPSGFVMALNPSATEDFAIQAGLSTDEAAERSETDATVSYPISIMYEYDISFESSEDYGGFRKSGQIFIASLSSVDMDLSPDHHQVMKNARERGQKNQPNWLKFRKYGKSFEMTLQKFRTRPDENSLRGIIFEEDWTETYPIDVDPDTGNKPDVYLGGMILKKIPDHPGASDIDNSWMAELEGSVNELLIVAGSTRGMGNGYGNAAGDDEDGFISVLSTKTGKLITGGNKSNRRIGTGETDLILGICDDPNDVNAFFIVGTTGGPDVMGEPIARTVTNINSGSLYGFVQKIQLDTLRKVWGATWGAKHAPSREKPTLTAGVGCHVLKDGSVYVSGVIEDGAHVLRRADENHDLSGDSILAARFAGETGEKIWLTELGSTDGYEELARSGGIAIDKDENLILFGDTTGSMFRSRDSNDDGSSDIFLTTLSRDDGSHDPIGSTVPMEPTPVPVPDPANTWANDWEDYLSNEKKNGNDNNNGNTWANDWSNEKKNGNDNNNGNTWANDWEDFLPNQEKNGNQNKNRNHNAKDLKDCLANQKKNGEHNMKDCWDQSMDRFDWTGGTGDISREDDHFFLEDIDEMKEEVKEDFKGMKNQDYGGYDIDMFDGGRNRPFNNGRFGIQSGPHHGSRFAGGMVYNAEEDSVFLTGITYYDSSSQPNCILTKLPLENGRNEEWSKATEKIFGSPDVIESCSSIALHRNGEVVAVGNADTGSSIESSNSGDKNAMQEYLTAGAAFALAIDRYELDRIDATPLVTKTPQDKIQYPISVVSDGDDLYVVSLTSTDSDTSKIYKEIEQITANGGSSEYSPNYINMQKYGTSLDMTVSKVTLKEELIDGVIDGDISFATIWSKEFPMSPDNDGTIPRVFLGGAIVKKNLGYLAVAGSTRGLGKGYGAAVGDDEDGFITLLDLKTGELSTDVNRNNIREGSAKDDIVLGICHDPDDDDSFFIVGATKGVIGTPATTKDIPQGSLQAFLRKVDANNLSEIWTIQWGAVHRSEASTPTVAKAFDCAVSGDVVYVGGVVDDNAEIVKGNSNRVSNGGDDIWVGSVSVVGGEVKWLRQGGSAGNDRIAPHGGLAISKNGNVIVFGDTDGAFYRERSESPLTDMFVMEFGKNGLHKQHVPSAPAPPTVVATPVDLAPVAAPALEPSVREKRISIGGIIGIVLGVILILIVFAVSCFVCRRVGCHRPNKTGTSLSSNISHNKSIEVKDGLIANKKSSSRFRDHPPPSSFSKANFGEENPLGGYSDNLIHDGKNIV